MGFYFPHFLSKRKTALHSGIARIERRGAQSFIDIASISYSLGFGIEIF
jgi:hypothetical protein